MRNCALNIDKFGLMLISCHFMSLLLLVLQFEEIITSCINIIVHQNSNPAEFWSYEVNIMKQNMSCHFIVKNTESSGSSCTQYVLVRSCNYNGFIDAVQHFITLSKRFDWSPFAVSYCTLSLRLQPPLPTFPGHTASKQSPWQERFV